MASGDGDGWVFCARCRQQHWGRFGAAGLLLTREAGAAVLLQLRAGWTHEGGRWGLVGGARDSHEDAAAAALREAAEEAAVDRAAVRVVGPGWVDDHVVGGLSVWSYSYVLAAATGPLDPRVLTAESDEVRWVPTGEVGQLPLHRGLAGAWPGLLPGIRQQLTAWT